MLLERDPLDFNFCYFKLLNYLLSFQSVVQTLIIYNNGISDPVCLIAYQIASVPKHHVRIALVKFFSFPSSFSNTSTISYILSLSVLFSLSISLYLCLCLCLSLYLYVCLSVPVSASLSLSLNHSLF